MSVDVDQDAKNLSYERLPRETVKDSPGSGISVRRSLRLHAVTACVVTLLALLAGGLVFLREKPTYIASSVIYVSPVFPGTLGEDKEHQYPYDSFIMEQIQAVSRQDVLLAAVRTLGSGPWRPAGLSNEAAAQLLQSSLQVARVGETYEVQVSLSGRSPDQLAEAVNAVTTKYVEMERSEQFYARDDQLTALHQERLKTLAALKEKQQELSHTSQAVGMALVPDAASSNFYDERVTKLQADLVAAREQRILAEAQLSTFASGADGSLPEEPGSDPTSNNPVLSATENSLLQKRSALASQLVGMTLVNPLRRAIQGQLSEIDASLHAVGIDQYNKSAAALQRRVNSAKIVEARLTAELDRGTAEATSAGPNLRKAEELQSEVQHLQARFVVVDERERDLDLESGAPGAVHELSPATTPTSPKANKRKLLLWSLLPLALGLGVVVVLAIDFFDPRLYSASQAEALVGFPPIGTILDAAKVEDVLSSEYMLRLATSVDGAVRVAKAKIFLITGVWPGVGSSYVAANVGDKLRAIGRKTLNLDTAALLARTVSAPGYVGSDAVSAPADAKPSILKLRQADRSSSAVITAEDLLRETGSEYDIILIDAPAVLISAQAEYLARLADVILLVAESGATKKTELARAVQKLERIRISGIGLVLNKLPLARADSSLRADVAAFRTSHKRSGTKPAEADVVQPVDAPYVSTSATPFQTAARENA